MKNFITWLKTVFPVLWSAQFWGTVGTALANLIRVKGWLDPDWMMFFTVVFGAATAIGVTLKAAKKIGGTVTANIDTVEKVTVAPPVEITP